MFERVVKDGEVARGEGSAKSGFLMSMRYACGAHVSVALNHWAISSGFSLRRWVKESTPPCSPRCETSMSTLFSGCSSSDVRSAGGSSAALAPAT